MPGTLENVTSESASDDEVKITLRTRYGRLNADLTIGADVSEGAVPLSANANLCLQGCKLVGAGFLITGEVRAALLTKRSGASDMLPFYVAGSGITKRTPERYAIDFFGMTQKEARDGFPEAFQIVLDRVRPERELNRRDTRRNHWWLFGENAPKLRRALRGLSRFIATSEVAKHRVFVFLPLPGTLADGSLAAIADDDAFMLGALSSRIHVAWALTAGGRMGVGDDPRYQNGPCFLSFPFPVTTQPQAERIRDLAESLDAHRKRQQAAHPKLTITGMYNVLEKLRSGEPLTDKEKVIHEQGLVSVLKKLHDDLDAAVFDAYGWPHDLTDEQILERLVALNAERAEEEKKGLIRWLRPDFQAPKKAAPMTQVALTAEDDDDEAVATAAPVSAIWPKKLPEQIGAIRDLVRKPGATWSLADVAETFKGAKKKDVEAVLESLAALGILLAYTTDEGPRWKAPGAAA